MSKDIMRGFRKAIVHGGWVAMGALTAGTGAQAADAERGGPAAPVATAPADAQARPPGVVTPSADPAAIGRNVLNAGPDPRVRLDGLSLDHAAIFGTQDEDEQALLDNERALQAQQEQLRVLERLLTQKPAAADPFPPAMIPLTTGTPMNMAPLAPAPSGSQLGGGEAQRSVDQMQRRVNEMRRGGEALRQGPR
ncbi:hypothetical protein [Achromobacter ruhlandii]|uniref:hypothetical protein n=1 Tax=Achromobacter ruhlandii TaxID=72557 RepID=UPI0020C64BD2|nr:hypothetical protein [Achromobacter ruhlandii]